MHSSKVEICGVNTSKLPVLKGEEKRKLFELILEGDEEAREQYIFGNLRLVLSIIQRFNNRGEYVDDIFQVGCIGLIKAIDNFDITQGVQFSTYAVPMDIIWREYSKENVSMTRKQALCMALETLEALVALEMHETQETMEDVETSKMQMVQEPLRTPSVTSDTATSEAHKTQVAINNPTVSEARVACDVIRGMISDLPLTGWTESTIFDSINQFIHDHGRTPTASDFRKKGLPPHPVIKLRFGITLREFLDTHYPKETPQQWQNFFCKHYHEIKPTSAEEYNAKRQQGSPQWQYIAKMHGIMKWVDWLILCDIVPYVSERVHYRAPRPKLTRTSKLTCYSSKLKKPFVLTKSADDVLRMFIDLPGGVEEHIMDCPPEATHVELGYQQTYSSMDSALLSSW